MHNCKCNRKWNCGSYICATGRQISSHSK